MHEGLEFRFGGLWCGYLVRNFCSLPAMMVGTMAVMMMSFPSYSVAVTFASAWRRPMC